MPLTNPLEVTVLSQAVVLTDEQIKELPTTPVEIVPAPGAGKIILPLYGVARLQWVSDYDNIHEAAQLRFVVGTAGDALFPFRQDNASDVSGLLAGGGPDGSIGWSPTRFSGKVPVAPGPVLGSGTAQFYDSDLVNFPLVFQADNGASGNFTGGNADNSLKVTVLYTIIDV